MMKFGIRYFLIGAIAVASVFTGCKKHVEQPNVEPGKGTLLLHLHSYIGNNEMEKYDTTLADAAGRKISMSFAQFYLSHFELVKMDGTLFKVSGKRILKTQDEEVYSLGEVPAETYKAIRFFVGLDSVADLDPWTADSAVLNRPKMWFGATAQPDGYIFLNAEGKIDTSSNLSVKMAPFVYHIGTSRHFVQAILPDKAFKVEAGYSQYIHLHADYSMLFSGLDLRIPANLNVASKADNASYVAETVAGNMKMMFMFEE